MVCLRQKAKIEYPCRWSYKIIAQKKDHIEVIAQKVCPPEYELKHSNNSKSGKYVSMNLSVLVHNEEQREEIFRQFEQHEDIKMVL